MTAGTTFTHCSGVRERIGRLNGSNWATSCTDVVSIRSIISEFTLIKRATFAAIRPQFYDDLYSSSWHSEMNWKIAILVRNRRTGYKVEIVLRLDRNMTIVVHSTCWRSKMDWSVAFRF